jgi:hypothetical protein
VQIRASTEELAGIVHQQVDYRQDDHEHEKAVYPDPGPILGGQQRGRVRPDGAPQRQRYPRDPVNLAGFAEDEQALQTNDEQDKGLYSVSVSQGAAREKDQRGEQEEARAEDDQARVDADDEVSGRLPRTERSERPFSSRRVSAPTLREAARGQ